MTTTDELRAMLDERGVKWEKGASLTNLYTYWTDCNGHDVTAVGTDSVMFMSHFVTPEQAIAATLGRGECEDTGGADEFCCSECGCVLRLADRDGLNTLCTGFIVDCPHYCPSCGRAVQR